MWGRLNNKREVKNRDEDREQSRVESNESEDLKFVSPQLTLSSPGRTGEVTA